jgi:hypothetical protein
MRPTQSKGKSFRKIQGYYEEGISKAVCWQQMLTSGPDQPALQVFSDQYDAIPQTFCRNAFYKPDLLGSWHSY